MPLAERPKHILAPKIFHKMSKDISKISANITKCPSQRGPNTTREAQNIRKNIDQNIHENVTNTLPTRLMPFFQRSPCQPYANQNLLFCSHPNYVQVRIYVTSDHWPYLTNDQVKFLCETYESHFPTWYQIFRPYWSGCYSSSCDTLLMCRSCLDSLKRISSSSLRSRSL